MKLQFLTVALCCLASVAIPTPSQPLPELAHCMPATWAALAHPGASLCCPFCPQALLMALGVMGSSSAEILSLKLPSF